MVNDSDGRAAKAVAGYEHLSDLIGQRGENIGTQAQASNLLIGEVLDSRPVFGGDENLAAEPVRDRLLADGGSTHEFGDSLSKGGLAANFGNRAPKRNNVRFIHDYLQYTTRVVFVNNHGRVPSHNHTCIVLKMPARQQKQAVIHEKPKRVRQAARGADSLTFGDRLKKCMEVRGRKLGRKYEAADLRAEANKLLGRDPDKNPIISQQGLSLILNNKVSESHATTVFAKILEVESMWLQYGIGPATYIESTLRSG